MSVSLDSNLGIGQLKNLLNELWDLRVYHPRQVSTLLGRQRLRVLSRQYTARDRGLGSMVLSRVQDEGPSPPETRPFRPPGKSLVLDQTVPPVTELSLHENTVSRIYTENPRREIVGILGPVQQIDETRSQESRYFTYTIQLHTLVEPCPGPSPVHS